MVRNKFDRFFQHRQSLIFQYKKGDLTKEEFIKENFDYIMSMNAKPFRKVDNIKKGIFNYQYYNAMAKYYQRKAHETINDIKRQEFIEISNQYYFKKDNVILKLLEIIDYTDVKAYYVKVKSSNLKNKLIEIVFKNYDNLVFHTTNKTIINRLMEEKAFINKKVKSVVDDYINEKY